MITLLVFLVVLGFVLWLFQTLVPMNPQPKTAIIGLLLLVAFLSIVSVLTGHAFFPLKC